MTSWPLVLKCGDGCWARGIRAHPGTGRCRVHAPHKVDVGHRDRIAEVGLSLPAGDYSHLPCHRRRTEIVGATKHACHRAKADKNAGTLDRTGLDGGTATKSPPS
jgi:hypothetical protein